MRRNAWLFLGVFCLLPMNRAVAQLPANYYELEYWSCSPSSCSNDSAGPVANDFRETSITGLCYNGIQPRAAAAAYAEDCSPMVLLSSSATPTPPGFLSEGNIKYRLDGVEAFAAVYDALGTEESSINSAMWCDAENHSEESPPQPCNEPPPPPSSCPSPQGMPSGNCNNGWIWDTSSCRWVCTGSPILIDVSGSGFQLTSAAGGVSFDISGTGKPKQMAWTAAGAMNAFLCLPDPNGQCDDGTDLFGNFTPQPPSNHPNGFAALAVYDQPANGGNGDGIIDSHDAIFSSLRLWIDANHDGISQPNEIYTLPALGVYSISLDYKLDQRTDQYGNVFRYRAQVNPGRAPDGVGRMAYDVFFVTQPGGSTTTAQSCASAPRLLPKGKAGRLH